ncbi:unnamed protein product [Prorocentrum cordatum]|uniref:Uncharacterized protein n=1 Tax=Prorocentrum cordatum TaxID=2364126 RepID=A0ABN9PQN6_9DINO|nr:unnamed protein product [Polarella glacialis]
MARVLKEHWSEVFRQQATDQHLRQVWLQEEARHFPPDLSRHIPGDVAPYSEFEKAIANASDSSPGPDGIPFKAWRRLGPLATRAFYDAFLTIVSPNGLDLLAQDWDAFNESSMVFLPKKPVGTMAEGLDTYTASTMRH